ncbi:MAG: fused MFS/spermidine synthase [Myxococcales bacterium]|nr:fused MFS/spermidine synthase [Myxococcales bacterium]
MPRRVFALAALLFSSGLCALVYQVAWLRELRLVFGASTPASAAVLAVFMGGLGLGSYWLGGRVDRSPRPLRLYAHLELGIALTAAVTPLLLVGARAIYVGVGGSSTLGSGLATVVRLLLSAVVLLPPTVLMGGTLPAAARAAVPQGDAGRRSTAWLYGANALGALAGSTLSTFLLLEVFGTRLTLWLACLLNALVGMIARMLSRSMPPLRLRGATAPAEATPSAPVELPPALARTARVLLLFAAGAVGFAFLVMELVWYRMLSPLLGGSTYTFGLILAVALGGIGVGGVAYTVRKRPPRWSTFAWTCALEAACLAVPYALGDRIALLAIMLRPLGVAGLAGQALGWTVIACIVVLPAAVVSGYQFPALIGLFGQGEKRIGREVGLAYAANTVGAIVGSLAAGFALMPVIGALGSWRAATALLCALCVGAALFHLRSARAGGGATVSTRAAVAGPLLVAGATVALLFVSVGPTALWRHTPIGAGRADSLLTNATRTELARQIRDAEGAVRWEADGRESSVALVSKHDTAFVVNGKSDGAVSADAGTQVMSGLLGPLLDPATRRVMVIGLGTGATAGWLAAVPEIERVDVVEIEPAIARVARDCAAANRDVLDSPKLALSYGDAREVLLTTRERYDLVFSEPSNPYRAGIASLFTREFYAAVKGRLRPGGKLVQWVQAYEIDAATLGTVVATLYTSFATVTVWRSEFNDLLLVASDEEEAAIDVAAVAARLREEPFRSATMAVWRVDTVEGVLSHFVARASFTRAIAAHAGPGAVNSDDRNKLEFGLARTVGRAQRFGVDSIQGVAEGRNEHRPAVVGAVDWGRVRDAYMVMGLVGNAQPTPFRPTRMGADERSRFAALRAWTRGDPRTAIDAWATQPRAPELAMELTVLADAYASTQHVDAPALIERLATQLPTDAALIRVHAAAVADRDEAAFEAALDALERLRQDPYAHPLLAARLFETVESLAGKDPRWVRPLFAALSEPCAADLWRADRLIARFHVALRAPGAVELCVEALRELEPSTPWNRTDLMSRFACYAEAQDPRAEAARLDLERFVDNEASSASDLVAPRGPAGAEEPAPDASAAASP